MKSPYANKIEKIKLQKSLEKILEFNLKYKVL